MAPKFFSEQIHRIWSHLVILLLDIKTIYWLLKKGQVSKKSKTAKNCHFAYMWVTTTVKWIALPRTKQQITKGSTRLEARKWKSRPMLNLILGDGKQCTAKMIVVTKMSFAVLQSGKSLRDHRHLLRSTRYLGTRLPGTTYHDYYDLSTTYSKPHWFPSVRVIPTASNGERRNTSQTVQLNSQNCLPNYT